MSYFTIKLYAMLFMLIDHIGMVVLNNDIRLRIIGRIAFPLFCFLLINGYYHTKNKWKYLGRMIIFAIISEVAFDVAVFSKVFEPGGQNVFVTLTLGLSGIILSEKVTIPKKWMRVAIKLIIWIAIAFACEYINADYGWYGILLIGLLYFTYGTSEKSKMSMAIAVLMANVINLIISKNVIQMFSILAIAYIFAFEERKVSVPKWKKTACYVFYPLHLIILAGIKAFL